jgi:hypothetical protein
MKNKPFDYKKEILADTAHLKMNMQILKEPQWTVNEINKRTEKLIEQIIELYPYLSASNDFEGIINEIKESDIKQNSQIKINVNDIQELKDKLIKFSETLANINSVQNLNINELLITNSSILYYVEKVEERIGLLDDRMDHLERLIRGLAEPDEWDDWNLLFRLLNILQIKISKLSITNKVAVNVTPMSAVDLAEFQFILREIEYKLKRLPYDQIKETGIDVSSIHNILESLSSMETIDPIKFEYYPLYPAVTKEPTNQ